MSRHRVPLPKLRSSLFARLLTASLLVALCSVAATAWLAVTTTTRAIRSEHGQSLDDDTRIYDALIGYGAEHTDWGGVQKLVDELAAQTGRTITVTTQVRRARLAGSEQSVQLPYRPTALVDPLRLDPVLSAGQADAIDPRAVGPYLLPAEDRQLLALTASKLSQCLSDEGIKSEIVTLPSGRPALQPPPPPSNGSDKAQPCSTEALAAPTRAERLPLSQVTDSATQCMKQQGRAAVDVRADFSWSIDGDESVNSERAARECVNEGRRQQLRSYVSPPALLFVGDRSSRQTADFEVTRENALRTAGAAALVLAVAGAVTTLVGIRLVRPLRALIRAAQHPAGQPVHVPVMANDEIGFLATAFNDLTKRREHLEEQRRSLVSDVAHELRTPLTNIRSWLEAAQDGLTPTNQELLALLLDEAVLLQHVIDDLRDLAAADAGNLTLHRELVDTAQLLEQVAVNHLGAAARAGVTVRTEGAEGLEIHADPVRLRQVIGNLLSNAIRHTPGGGFVVLRTRVEDEQLVMEVIDSGVGIDPADLGQVFDRFWRTDKSRTRQTGGSGLGLAIVRKLTEAHGGSVSVSSSLGEGSAFIVRLPFS